MNCNCYKEIAEKFEDRGQWENREIINVKMNDLLYTFGTNGGSSGTLSYQEFEVELDGLKKPKKIKISHTYCPYSGAKAGKIDTDAPDNNPLEY